MQRDDRYALLEHLPLGFALLDAEGGTVWMNAAARRILGSDSIAGAGLTIEDDGQPWRPAVTDGSMRARGGRSVHVVAARAESGLFLCIEDISSHRDALRESRERYVHIVEHANEMIYRTDHRGCFTYLNPAARRITGYDESELIGRHYLDLIDPDYREAASHFYQHQFTTRQHGTYFELPMVTKSGMRIWLGQNVLSVLDGPLVLGYEAIARDITQRRGVEEELARTRDAALQSARAKSAFLANVSHEVRTPLNGVLGMTGLLMGTPLTPEQRDYVETIRSSGETLLSIVNDVLDLARIESGKFTVEPVDFNLDDLVESVVEQFVPRATAKRLKLRTFAAPDVCRALRGDSLRIRQVLLNLVGNAVKFTDRGEVVLTVMQPQLKETTVVLRFLVTDTGIGLSPRAQQKIFTPFTQADGSTTRKYGGSGLGLSVSRQLIEAMGGEIGVISVEGEGSTFWFELPLTRLPDTTARPAQKWDLASFRALLADASEVHRLMLVRHLSATGLDIDEAESAGEALARIAGQTYDIVIFDMQLPDEDGLALARAIRRNERMTDARLLLVTAYGRRRQDVIAFQAAGIDAFLIKPVRRTQLCDAVARLLLADEGPAALPELDEEPPSAARARVLVVEDNSVNQLVTLGQLQRLGHSPVLAANGADALAAVAESQFDLVLMDCQMPDMDGYEVTRRIRRLAGQASATPIVALTAHALPGEREKCLTCGMNDYLAKPVTLEQLGAVIRLWASKTSQDSAAGEDVLEGDDVHVLDRERVSSFLAISRTQTGFLEGLVKAFREDVPSRLDALRAAAAGGDPDDLILAAHALKSSSGSVGARRVYAMAASIERAARDGKLGGARSAIDLLATELDRVLVAYDGILRRSSGPHPAATQAQEPGSV